jgi:hypothetical protein
MDHGQAASKVPSRGGEGAGEDVQPGLRLDVAPGSLTRRARPPSAGGLLALNGLRVSEATGADIEHLGLERGHRRLTTTRKGRLSWLVMEQPAEHFPAMACRAEDELGRSRVIGRLPAEIAGDP